MWFQDARTLYNIVLGDLITKHAHWIESHKIKEIVTYMRTHYVVDKTLKDPVKWLYLNRTPSVIRKGAIDSLMSDLTRYRTNRKEFLKKKKLYPNALKYKGEPQKFHVRFKSWLFDSDSIGFEK